jgi:hypothetical protein
MSDTNLTTASAGELLKVGPTPIRVRYATLGLRRCYMPRAGLWSHKYHLDGRPEPNESVPPHSDSFYSLNVLLGFARNPEIVAGEPYHLAVC